MTDERTFEIVENFGFITVRIPYGKQGRTIGLDIIDGKLRLQGGLIDLDQAEQLATGLLEAIAYARSKPPAG